MADGVLPTPQEVPPGSLSSGKCCCCTWAVSDLGLCVSRGALASTREWGLWRMEPVSPNCTPPGRRRCSLVPAPSWAVPCLWLTSLVPISLPPGRWPHSSAWSAFLCALGLAGSDCDVSHLRPHGPLLCFSLEYVTFLTVTPNMTSVHIVNRRPLFTHLGKLTQGHPPSPVPRCPHI